MRHPWLIQFAVLAALFWSAACSRSADTSSPHGAGHEAAADSSAYMGPAPPSAESGSALSGHAEVTLTADRVQKFGVRTTRAGRAPLERTVRTVGIVRTDETRESHVHVKWSGWIEEFFVSYVGQSVEKGEPLFSVYSPDLFGAQQELITAARRARASPGAAAESLLAASRGKLRHWDVPEETIAEIETSGAIRRAIEIRAPRDGTVVSRDAVPGMYVEPPMALYTIADLTRVWVVADVFEYEAPLVREGQRARFVPVGSEAREVEGEVAFVSPTVDPVTRTVKVRLDVANEDGALRPGGYGTVFVVVPAPDGLVVPSDAVIDTGARTIVFVDKGGGLFEPRDVKLGARTGGNVEVRSGLAEGESVVTRAQFLLDSESRIRGAGASKPDHAGH